MAMTARSHGMKANEPSLKKTCIVVRAAVMCQCSKKKGRLRDEVTSTGVISLSTLVWTPGTLSFDRLITPR